MRLAAGISLKEMQAKNRILSLMFRNDKNSISNSDIFVLSSSKEFVVRYIAFLTLFHFILAMILGDGLGCGIVTVPRLPNKVHNWVEIWTWVSPVLAFVWSAHCICLLFWKRSIMAKVNNAQLQTGLWTSADVRAGIRGLAMLVEAHFTGNYLW